jgi:hypothetical protein
MLNNNIVTDLSGGCAKALLKISTVLNAGSSSMSYYYFFGACVLHANYHSLNEPAAM